MEFSRQYIKDDCKNKSNKKQIKEIASSLQPTPVFLPGESQGQRSLVGYSPWGHKESDTTE